jgi:hypothetical protein
MKLFATSMLAAAAAAAEAESLSHDNYTLNHNYDNPDPDHYFYGGMYAASGAYPIAPNLSEAVQNFDNSGTLFGEHRYQLQVAKTANMLIAVEALRESVAAIQDRVVHAVTHLNDNDGDIDENDSDIDDNRT